MLNQQSLNNLGALLISEKITQIPDFFVETLIARDESDSEVGDLLESIPLFSNANAGRGMLFVK